MSTRLRGVKRRRGKAKVMASRRPRERRLAEMSVDEFMDKGMSSDEESEVEGDKEVPHLRTKYEQSKWKRSSASEAQLPVHKLAEIDPDFFEYLQKEDSDLLETTGLGRDLHLDRDSGGGEGEGEDERGESEESGDEDGMVEPRPLYVTSRKYKEADDKEAMSSEGESEMDEDDASDGGAEREGERLTKEMLQVWVKSLSGQRPSLPHLRSLSTALHDAINGLLVESANTSTTYFVDDPSVFNSLVISCIKSVPHSLSLLLPRPPATSRGRTPPPSTLKGWSKVKTTIKVYLSDLVRLLDSLKDASMRCALLKHIQSLSDYYLCFPKLVRQLQKLLVRCWSEGESHVQVMAFIVLRRLTMLQPHPALHHLLKKLYLAFVSNCKFTSAKTLPHIRFMQNCLVELLTVDPPTSYQHAFVYVRQLAIHLRTAMTSGKKQAVQAVYNWQFIHCLDLWSLMLCQVTHDSLRPLVYPLVQVMVGVVNLQPSSRHYPLRLHIVKTLLELSSATGTFIPVAPYLLEIFESQGVGVASHVTTGKPPNLSILLHATKQQLQSSAFQNALLNEAYELMLRYFSIYSPTIGFPELSFPSLVRLRKVCKSTHFSWLRLQVKQLIEKVEAVGSEVTKLRATVDFSPKDHQLVAAWERERRERGNAVTNLLVTWSKVHTQTQQQTEQEDKESSLDDEESDDVSISDEEECAESADNDSASDGDDIVEDFELSSDDSD